MTLEDGLSALAVHRWQLGGLLFDRLDEAGDDGLDDTSELEHDEQEGPGDGEVAGDQRMAPRAITLNAFLNGNENPADPMTTLAEKINNLRAVMSPLPDRTATRLLRFRRQGEVAKRTYVRPATGRPLTIPGDRNRLTLGQAPCALRLTAPDPVILSDDYHSVSFTTGQEREIVNAGSFTARQPIAWWITSSVPVAIEHLDFDEYIRFPKGPVETTRSLTISAPGAFGLCYGPSSSIYPQWPLLRPGVNNIKASAPCTFNWRDTW